jgi:hypothetical protein
MRPLPVLLLCVLAVRAFADGSLCCCRRSSPRRSPCSGWRPCRHASASAAHQQHLQRGPARPCACPGMAITAEAAGRRAGQQRGQLESPLQAWPRWTCTLHVGHAVHTIHLRTSHCQYTMLICLNWPVLCLRCVVAARRAWPMLLLPLLQPAAAAALCRHNTHLQVHNSKPIFEPRITRKRCGNVTTM